MEWRPHQWLWHPQIRLPLPMGFLVVILAASLPLITKSTTGSSTTFPVLDHEKHDDQVALVPQLKPQAPDSGIKCTEYYCTPNCGNPCPCVLNPSCTEQNPPRPPPPPLPPPPPITDQYSCPLAPPPPPRLSYTMSDLDDTENLYDTADSSNVGVLIIVIIVILILILVGLGVLLWRCAGPCNRILDKICF